MKDARKPRTIRRTVEARTKQLRAYAETVEKIQAILELTDWPDGLKRTSANFIEGLIGNEVDRQYQKIKARAEALRKIRPKRS